MRQSKDDDVVSGAPYNTLMKNLACKNDVLVFSYLV